MTKKEGSKSMAKNERTWWIAGAALVIVVLALVIFTRQPAADTEIPTPPEEPGQDVPEEPLPTVDEPAVEVPEEPTLAVANGDIVKLLDKMSGIKSLTFIATTYTLSRGDLQQVDIGTYSILGDDAKVKPLDYISMDGWSADTVYLDLAEEAAWGYCISISSCRDLEKKGSLSYERFRITMPEDWADTIKYGEIVTSRMYNNRRVSVVEWEADGLYWEALIEDYYGIPVKVTAASDAERANIVQGVEYRSMTFNNVKASDVTPPY